MTDDEVMKYLEIEKQKYNIDFRDNLINEIITDGLILGSTMSYAALASLLFDNVSFENSALVAVTMSSISFLKNHEKYARANDTKENIRILKQIKLCILKGNNPFKDIEEKDFDKYLRKLYNYH